MRPRKSKTKPKKPAAPPRALAGYRVLDTVDVDIVEERTERYGHQTEQEHHSLIALERVTNEAYGADVNGPVAPHDHLYLVYAQYDTGDSFNTYQNRMAFVAAYATQGQAQECIATLNRHHADVCDRENETKKRKDFSPFSVTVLADDGLPEVVYCPWHGYFEHNQYFDMMHLEVRE